MPTVLLVAAVLAPVALGYFFGRRWALGAGGRRVPGHFGIFVGLCALLPGLAVLALWLALEERVVTAMAAAALPAGLAGLPAERLALVMNQVANIAAGTVAAQSEAMAAAAAHYRALGGYAQLLMPLAVAAAAAAGFMAGRRMLRADFAARSAVERIVLALFMVCSCAAILTTVGIVLSVLFETLRFFEKVSPAEFLFGLEWSPQTAIRQDQVGASGSFGAVPVFAGTLLITVIAMAVAAPLGLLSAVYLAEYAPRRVRAVAKPLLELLAGIPTVVYGFFAALTVAPLVRDGGAWLGLTAASESALAAGLVMGVMIIPFVSSLSDDVISAVPAALRDGSLGLGATRSETIRRVVLPAALPGIAGSLRLAVSRAIGETMIVVMAAGLAARLTANPLDAVTTVTVQIVTLLTGDQEFDSAKTLAAFALGLLLFLVTLIMNLIALFIVKRYRENYE